MVTGEPEVVSQPSHWFSGAAWLTEIVAEKIRQTAGKAKKAAANSRSLLPWLCTLPQVLRQLNSVTG
jgi:hypothetical protein